MTSGFGLLTPQQRELVAEWLPGAELIHDHSRGPAGTRVLELEGDRGKFIVKAGDDERVAQEIRAHEQWLSVWVPQGRAPALAWADSAARILVTRYLPGVLVEGAGAEFRANTYHQAGELLAAFHAQAGVQDDDYEARARAKTLWRLEQPHRIPAATVSRLRELVAAWPTPPVRSVPTHGDWQPRDWLIEDGVVRVIDFGHAALRPAWCDFTRLAAQQFRTDSRFEAAFLAGYGERPGDEAAWQRACVREAIGTAVFAHRIGNQRFEQQGLRMIAAALDAPGSDRR
ncbi:aminoglycoside phosphotransferase family protein [Kineosporia rhizophila]|uniref:aminoglycoside phosphotransferase family protein n=1 Tax=Kineosporia rhizophila TaxID=84633 RepID=UPI001E3E514D|nr:aminoglycoside phosphotransferase family protein [Kineosporia rhizophila]MCE0537561.1 aminoglycoside phosphotransferase family protein [Kineosporia rhizophila]